MPTVFESSIIEELSSNIAFVLHRCRRTSSKLTLRGFMYEERKERAA